MSGFQDLKRKLAIQEHFDHLAGERARWLRKASYYYADQRRYVRFLVPERLRVLEVGCGLGDLLACVKPSRGLGLDLSEAMVKEASARHPSLEFRAADVETLQLDETFDVIILSDVIGYLFDVEAALRRLRACCTSQTRVVITYYNFLWEPVLRPAEAFGLKMPQPGQSWLSPADIENLLHLADYEVVKTERRLLVPKYIPVVSAIFNRFLAFLPGVSRLCLSHYVVARARGVGREAKGEAHRYSVTIAIPCRNERGNIEPAVRRIPQCGARQEIIFIDGHSTDGTPDEIRRVIRTYLKIA